MKSKNLSLLSSGTAVITGAGSGIGEGLATVAAAQGLSVVLADIDKRRVERVADSIRRKGGDASSYEVDVSAPVSVEKFAEEVFDQHGEVRLIINNAGVEATGRLWEMQLEHWRRVMGVNLDGVFNCIRAFAPLLIARQEPAHIINVASLAALSSGPTQQAAYNASKHAVLALTETLYLEVQAAGAPLEVHVVCPGPVRSRIFTEASSQEGDAELAKGMFADYVEEAGISSLEAAQLILDGIEAGEFWISTHPEMQVEFMDNRAKMLGQRRAPAPYVPGLSSTVPKT